MVEKKNKKKLTLSISKPDIKNIEGDKSNAVSRNYKNNVIIEVQDNLLKNSLDLNKSLFRTTAKSTTEPKNNNNVKVNSAIKPQTVSNVGNLSHLIQMNKANILKNEIKDTKQELELSQDIKKINKDEVVEQKSVVHVKAETVEVPVKVAKVQTDNTTPKPNIIKDKAAVEGTEEKYKYSKKRVDTSKKYLKSKQILERNSDSEYYFKPKSRKNKNNKVKRKKLAQTIRLHDSISVSELSHQMGEKINAVIRELKTLGMNKVNDNTILDKDTIELVASHFGHRVQTIQKTDIEKLIDISEQKHDTVSRGPVVTIMGHVDHGKTSLLDALKSTNVAAKESGGITQHIGAYTINTANGTDITFIDTPGHEAFMKMRMRGASVTDIVILVIAADDGVKAQTIEAIDHARAANVPIIVAINKIDKKDINLDRLHSELMQHNIISEEYGGDNIFVPISAKNKINLDKLLDTILLVADMQDLRTNKSIVGSGVVLESSISKLEGVKVTVLIKHGIIKKGDIIACENTYGKIKLIKDYLSNSLDKATSPFAVVLYGFDSVPESGDKFYIVKNEKQAREFIEHCKKMKSSDENTFVNKKMLFDKLLSDSSSKQVDFPMIIKADVHGSVETISSIVDKMNVSEHFNVNILRKAVGPVSSSDIMLAASFGSVIFSFGQTIDNNIRLLADKNRVIIYEYDIIYDLIDKVKELLSGLLPNIISNKFIGSMLVQQVFDISKMGLIAGGIVNKGFVKSNSIANILRNGKTIYQGKIKTLKRFKDDVKEVREGYECGVSLHKCNDIKEQDVIEFFETIEEKVKLT